MQAISTFLGCGLYAYRQINTRIKDPLQDPSMFVTFAVYRIPGINFYATNQTGALHFYTGSDTQSHPKEAHLEHSGKAG